MDNHNGPMNLDDWHKMQQELKKNTQREANRIYRIRRNTIIGILNEQLNLDIVPDQTVKKGRPKLTPTLQYPLNA